MRTPRARVKFQRVGRGHVAHRVGVLSRIPEEIVVMIRWRPVIALAFTGASTSPIATALSRGAEQIPGTKIQGGCDVPVTRRTSETGWYLVATVPLGILPDVSLFWHLHRFQTRAQAEAAAQSRSTVVESLGYIWLYTIAEEGWRPTAGERVAVIGPLPITKGTKSVARYMEAVFAPGMQTAVHRHSGPEAWYVLAGSQCLRNAGSDDDRESWRGCGH